MSEGMQEVQGGEPATRTRWLGALLIVLVLAVVVWLAQQAGDEPPPPVPPPAAVAALSTPSLGDMLAEADSRFGAPALPLAPPAAASEPMAADETEVCGLGRVKADPEHRPRDMAPITRAVGQARERVLPLLLAGDDTARAAGLLLQALGEPEAGDGLPAADASQARDALAQMAVATRSPGVYAWAMRACQRERGSGACALLSADQWARLEPGNAIAWLNVAADAQARGDSAGVAEAMYRVSHASRSDARWGALVGVVLARVPADTGLLAKAGLAMDVAAVDTRAEIPLVAASQYCSVPAVRDANRQQVCAAVAEVLATRGSTLVEASLGATLGQRVGWPAERVAAAADERDAMAQLSRLPQPPGVWSCAGLVKVLSQLTEVGQHGELAALRAALKRSPDGVATLARRYRETALATTAPAAPAASAAASALRPS
ncbi:MAG: hypothetical protein KF891_18030 [Rhizobacter sp.]|nr:hypothetical protein [Rhizobacter sp.]